MLLPLVFKALAVAVVVVVNERELLRCSLSVYMHENEKFLCPTNKIKYDYFMEYVCFFVCSFIDSRKKKMNVQIKIKFQ